MKQQKFYAILGFDEFGKCKGICTYNDQICSGDRLRPLLEDFKKIKLESFKQLAVNAKLVEFTDFKVLEE